MWLKIQEKRNRMWMQNCGSLQVFLTAMSFFILLLSPNKMAAASMAPRLAVKCESQKADLVCKLNPRKDLVANQEAPWDVVSFEGKKIKHSLDFGKWQLKLENNPFHLIAFLCTKDKKICYRDDISWPK